MGDILFLPFMMFVFFYSVAAINIGLLKLVEGWVEEDLPNESCGKDLTRMAHCLLVTYAVLCLVT